MQIPLFKDAFTKYEKKTFYSFLALYFISLTIFVFIIAFLFYKMNYNLRYENIISRMQLVAKQLSSKIIMQHMNGVKPKDANFIRKWAF